jgi:hypothetical protein
MQLSFLLQASVWGQVFEIAVKRGVLLHLIHQGLLPDNHRVLEPWQAVKNADIENQLVKTLKLTDTNARVWAGTMVRHLLVLGLWFRLDGNAGVPQAQPCRTSQAGSNLVSTDASRAAIW